MKNEIYTIILLFSAVVLGGCVMTGGSADAAPESLPLTIEPGVTQRGQQPETWTVDLRELDWEAAKRLEPKLSSRIYGTSEAHWVSPMTFLTGFEEEKVFGFFLSRASQAGAVLDVFVDDEFFHRLSWGSARTTHEVDTLFTLPIPAGASEIRLEVGNGVVVIDRYEIMNTESDSAGQRTVRLEKGERRMAGDKDNGYRGIWFTLGQFSEYGDKYSGGLGTYTANHIPLAVYAKEVNKTFFVYGGTIRDQRHLLIMASYYDHEKNRVPRPTIVHDKKGVNDPHDNPSIAMDGDGHIWVFISGRGRGRPGFKYRSVEPYSVDAFEMIKEQEMTYPQPWWVEGKGFIHMLTKYTKGRELYFETSPDGYEWSEDVKLAGIGGHYQVSAEHNGKIGSFFNRHPGGERG